jgi:hypothetical protein
MVWSERGGHIVRAVGQKAESRKHKTGPFGAPEEVDGKPPRCRGRVKQRWNHPDWEAETPRLAVFL